MFLLSYLPVNEQFIVQMFNMSLSTSNDSNLTTIVTSYNFGFIIMQNDNLVNDFWESIKTF